jgi:tripeptide aminopeptidase
MEENNMTILERFINYVTLDTQSDADSPTQPSTRKQMNLLTLLVKELNDLGVKDVRLDDQGYIYGSLPSNTDKKMPKIGFLAHVDTASEMSGKDVKPQVIPNYNGQRIALLGTPGVFLDPKQFPELKFHRKKTIVTTDGTTLLGADDKAGCAIIMTLIETLLKQPEIPHGEIKFAFTTDEEIGRGVKAFDVKAFGADFAYTLDGGAIDEINYENFNASSAVLSIQGQAIHPGSAKDKMINAQTVAMEFHALLPKKMTPAHTEKYQGFIHMTESTGSVEKAELRYIIRDHDMKKLQAKEMLMKEAFAIIQQRYGKNIGQLTIKPSYKNMKPMVDKYPISIERAKQAYRQEKLPLKAVPIRGGTDGANLTFMGIVTPNLATGGYNYHGKYEYWVVEDGLRMVDVLLAILKP